MYQSQNAQSVYIGCVFLLFTMLVERSYLMKIFAVIVAILLIVGCSIFIVFTLIDIIKKIVAKHKEKKASKDTHEKGNN